MRLRAALIAIALSTGVAAARSEKTLAYAREEVWSTAVRFLIVDEHVKVTDKDPDAGYVMFEIKDDGKVFRGSLEVMTVMKDKRPSVRFVLQIEDRPNYLEVGMLVRLERKLRAELGAPAPPPAKDSPKAPPKDEPPKSDDGAPPISPTP